MVSKLHLVQLRHLDTEAENPEGLLKVPPELEKEANSAK